MLSLGSETKLLMYWKLGLLFAMAKGGRTATHRECKFGMKKRSLKAFWILPYSVSTGMDVWQGVAIDSLRFCPVRLCLTLLRPLGGPPLKRLYNRFRSGPAIWRAACGRLLPPRHPTPYASGSHRRLRASASRAAKAAPWR